MSAHARASRRRGDDEALERYLALRPTVLSSMEATVPAEMRAEFAAVTAHQLRALVALGVDGLTMRRLAGTMHVTGATASVLADRLVARGLAERTHEPADRRIVRLVPTAEGRALAGRYLEAQRRAVAAMLTRLSPSQVAALLDVMETLAAPQTAGTPLEVVR